MERILVSLVLCAILSPCFGFQNQPDSVKSNTGSILIMDIKAEIDPRMNRYVELALERAAEDDVSQVIIHMDTYGGLVTDAKDIVENILTFPKPVWVFIDKDAASAGALISIACDSIFMAPGASIGAATVVGQTGEAAPDKYQSYMRSTMRSTAEETGRDPAIAEAMVDQNIAIEGVTEEGEVITFSVSEAQKFGFCEGKFNDLDELLEFYELQDREKIFFELSSTDSIIAFFLNPFISGILILVILGGIYFELQTPGVGFPIAAAAVALVLYLVPYYLNGLAESWEIIAFVVGVVLIALEIFVIPGFGVAGILGISMSISALILIMLDNDLFDFSLVPFEEIFTAVITTFGGLLGGVIVMFLGGVRLANSTYFDRVALTNSQKKEDGYTSSFNAGKSMVGKKGKAYTNLRPSGKIMVADELHDAYTRGDYIDQGEKVIIISDEGTSLKVKRDEG